MRLYIYIGAILALAGCTTASGDGPRPSSFGSIEPAGIAMPTAGAIAPGPNLRTVMPRPAASPRRIDLPRRCAPGHHWVKAHREKGPLGTSRYVPGHCR